MQVVIEFYRTRNEDDAHAVVGRETKEAVDLAGADQFKLAAQRAGFFLEKGVDKIGERKRGSV
ncbi:hypothetical protein ASD64_06605 [Mesorhizobium sp. Root157]|uniref:hypothetical protein n=1 Tax=Mesorhizobium sp. Root157 TaxID=1736477 RepID=UPI0006F69630|nr:hypothetical protein [Mesorhizobium sp. Root157]KQZ87110.1 hypothetical protein ASD64_06605 [Mesorhizobium sp. Root157]